MQREGRNARLWIEERIRSALLSCHACFPVLVWGGPCVVTADLLVTGATCDIYTFTYTHSHTILAPYPYLPISPTHIRLHISFMGPACSSASASHAVMVPGRTLFGPFPTTRSLHLRCCVSSLSTSPAAACVVPRSVVPFPPSAWHSHGAQGLHLPFYSGSGSRHVVCANWPHNNPHLVQQPPTLLPASCGPSTAAPVCN